MKKEDCKPGVYVFWKGDIEEQGQITSKPDKNGYVNITGPDTEQGPQDFNVHYSDLEKA